jgi:drug/metabolite transporter (DMT)-like permease
MNETSSMPSSANATPSNATPSMSATDWALLVFLSVLWGGSFYFAKIAVPEIPPLTLAFGRVGIAAVVLAVVARLMVGPFPRDPSIWRQLAFMAALNNAIPFVLLFWGQIHISIGLASILNATSPLFGVVVAHALTHDDRLNLNRVVGLVAGFIGVVVLIGPGLVQELGADIWAELACLGAACSYAFGAVLTRRLRKLSPIMVASGQLTMSTMLLLPLVLLFSRPSSLLTASGPALGGLIGLALLCSALAYLIYFRLIARAGATNALLTTFLIPVSAIVIGIMLLGESVSLRQLAGMAAIFVGIAAIDGRAGRLIARQFRRTTA